MKNEPMEETLKVTGVFEWLGVPYLIGGSLASTLYGMIRTTQDSDIVAEMRLEHLQPFVSALQDEFYVDDEMIAEAIERNSSFNIIHRESFFKVDVFIPRPRPFLQAQLARAQKQTFTFETEVSAKFASPEDTILAKLEWYRLGGEVSERQWRDILGVLKTRAGELDLAYLRKWANELKLYEADSRLATNFLLIAPNIIVLDRLRSDFDGLKIFFQDPLLPDITATRVKTGRMIFK